MATPLTQDSTIKVDTTSSSSGVPITSGAINTTGAQLGYLFVVSYNSVAPQSVSDSKGNAWALDPVGSAGVICGGDPEYLWVYKSLLLAGVGTGHTFTVVPDGNFGVTFVPMAFKPSVPGNTLTATAWNGIDVTTSPHTGTTIDPPDECLLVAAGSHDQASSTQTYNWSISSFTEVQAEKDFSTNFVLSVATRNYNSASTVAPAYASAGSVTHGAIGVIAIAEVSAGSAALPPPANQWARSGAHMQF